MGQNTLVRGEDIVGIFDLDNVTVQKASRDFLNSCELVGEVKNIATDIPRSFIVCSIKQKRIVYLSQLSPTTLLKRAYYAERYNYERAENI